MIENLPSWIDIGFVLVAIITIVFFYVSNGKPKFLALIIIIWSIIQSILAYLGYYRVLDVIPPRFALVILPIIVVFIYAFLPKQIDWSVKRRNSYFSTLSHSIRIPIEVFLYYLFLHEMIPELMTFEGRNFDILVGLSAPIVCIMLYTNKISKKGLLVWNIIGLIMVCSILVNGLLSAELPIQQFGFDQPNRAVTFFPFILLPAMIVPIVIYTHIIDIIKLKRELNTMQSNR